MANKKFTLRDFLKRQNPAYNTDEYVVLYDENGYELERGYVSELLKSKENDVVVALDTDMSEVYWLTDNRRNLRDSAYEDGMEFYIGGIEYV